MGAVGLFRATVVEAAKGSNSACDAFCDTIFGNTRAAGQCASQGAHGTGPCVDCGNDPTRYCNGTCCLAGQTCQNGTCLFPNQGTCPTGTSTCVSGGAQLCNDNQECACYVTTEGETKCAWNVVGQGTGLCGECTSSADCIANLNNPEAFCAQTVGTFCCPSPISPGICYLPCPS